MVKEVVDRRRILEEAKHAELGKRASARRAVEKGEKTWECEIDGAPWVQQTFPYQAKCLRWTNEQYQALSASDRALVDAVLEGTGIEAMLFAS